MRVAVRLASGLRTLAVLLAALAAIRPAHAEVPPEVAAAPGADEYPLADGLWVWRRVDVIVASDGRVTRAEDSALKMLGDRAARGGHLDPHIDWNDARAELKVEDARTWMVDGTEVVARDNSFVPNTAAGLDWAVPYAALRRMTVAHVGVEHGSTSHLAYAIADRAPAPVPAWGSVPLQDAFPALALTVRVTAPAAPSWAILGGEGVLEPAAVEGGPSVRVEGGSLVLEAEGVPAFEAAEGWPAPRLVWSTATSWDEVRKALRGRIEAASEPDERVRTKAEELLEGAAIPEERVARLHRFVAEGLRTIQVPVEAFDHAPRDAGDVLVSSVGHPLDKAVLLAALLRAGGTEAQVAFAASGWAVAEAVPSPAVFDQAWVVTDQGWLDPTSIPGARDAWDLEGHPVLRLDGSGPPATFAAPSGNSAAFASITLAIGTGDRDLEVSGGADVDLRRRYHPAPAWDRTTDRLAPVAEGIAAGFGGAEVDDVVPARIDGELCSFGATFSGGTIPFDEAGFARLAIPRVPGAVGGLQTWRQARAVPVRVPVGAERVRVEIALPEGVSAVVLPEAVRVENAAGRLVRTVTTEAGKVAIDEELVFASAVVGPSDWGDLKALLAGVEAERSRAIWLERVK